MRRWSDYAAVSSKPLFVAEFGVDRLNVCHRSAAWLTARLRSARSYINDTLSYGESQQATYFVSQWSEIARVSRPHALAARMCCALTRACHQRSDIGSGGFVFEYVDEVGRVIRASCVLRCSRARCQWWKCSDAGSSIAVQDYCFWATGRWEPHTRTALGARTRD